MFFLIEVQKGQQATSVIRKRGAEGTQAVFETRVLKCPFGETLETQVTLYKNPR